MTAGWWGGWDADVTVRQAMAFGASQEPEELAQALGMIAAIKPRRIVEIGCDRGGTLFAWRSVCELVLGVTLADNGYDTGGSGGVLESHGADTIVGDSHDAAVLGQVTGWCGGELDVLVIDGDHTPEGVRADLAGYGPLVRPGGLILLHDIAPSSDPRSRVHEVWPALAQRYATEEIRNPDGGFGWGVITVAEGDRFG